MANLYLREDLADATVGGEIAIEGAEAKHIVSVSRTRAGEALTVSNGCGLVVDGTVTSAEPSRVVARVDAVTRVEPQRPRLVLVQALAKGDRDELAVQASVELGVDEVVPWQASRSVSRWQGDKAVKGVQRWRTIVREATKQSMRAWLPEVAVPATIAGLTSRARASRMLVLEPGAPRRLSEIRVDSGDDRDLVVVVGPEGGIAPDETERLVEAGAEAVRLGSSVLRTSSAGPAALAVLNVALGRW
ncbi:16S rRNA (uracil(1498)-N(3))-methyltransferase [Humibacter sp.]|jgi:16S rRNA (uracil1498-N3)-methyltransferase|uniref:16S rRNA (uracil(1498)-N(3))-methyltransferase n=1 Tax=Humibacter sp. TaxID=1940291 RepID=UPI002B897B59|nr:16S rRNA (uracil(1498)-N(3))-methyltransferase [Humibacter sp.]HVX06601.1 16S rRNA (uracil(1498)-N(3))-methyltransferase [Humibacter sp.]